MNLQSVYFMLFHTT